MRHRHLEEREARLEGSTARLVAVHPSRLAPLAPRDDGNEPTATLAIGDKLSLIAVSFTPHASALAIKFQQRLVTT
ncbi:hypothetical protein chiPu_0030345 [Chiloscyllium punctatum]|uniref:Uncharacterized protein n=1 Tax=Chiloscyllium punctatum TaxID=137246 RepID=A0A401TUV1_CHIPU|nr:hypothetical protein [Chiloscyllium punctatum]